MENIKTLFRCSSKYQTARKRISSKFIDNLSTRLQKVSQGLFQDKSQHISSFSLLASCRGFIIITGNAV